MNHWQQVERCVRQIHYDIDAGRITRAIEVDDRMLACSGHLVERIRYRRFLLKTGTTPMIRPLQEANVLPEPT